MPSEGHPYPLRSQEMDCRLYFWPAQPSGKIPRHRRSLCHEKPCCCHVSALPRPRLRSLDNPLPSDRILCSCSIVVLGQMVQAEIASDAVLHPLPPVPASWYPATGLETAVPTFYGFGVRR
jgi:hypothetical protein